MWVQYNLIETKCQYKTKNKLRELKERRVKVVTWKLTKSQKEYIEGLSILGGEPLHPKNIDASTKLAKKFKETYPEKTIWVWTGFNYENNLKDKEILKYIDYLVDGQFIEEQKNPKLKYAGSSNQRVIDIKKTLKKGQVVEISNN